MILEPLSFKEFRELADAPEGSQFADLDRYLTNGGFPILVLEDSVRALDRTRELAAQCLSAIHGIRLDARLRHLFAILMDQSSEELNVQALSRELGVKRPTLENWIAALEDSFLVHRLTGIETNEMRRLRHAKLHATDPGLVAAFASLSDPLVDHKVRGRMLEAAVLRHLRELARMVRGKLMFAQLRGSSTSKRGEVDFLLVTAREVFFVEVTGSATGSEKTKRIFNHIASYRDHGKTKSQLGDRRTFALVVAGRPAEEPGVAPAALFLDHLLEAQGDDQCESLRRMSREVP